MSYASSRWPRVSPQAAPGVFGIGPKCTINAVVLVNKQVYDPGAAVATPRNIDYQLVASTLSAVDGVDGVYVDESGPAATFWTVLSDYSRNVRKAVFRKERELRRRFAQQNPAPRVAFHVISREWADRAITLKTVFKRAER